MGVRSEIVGEGDTKIDDISALRDLLIKENVLKLFPMKDVENGRFRGGDLEFPAQRPKLDVLERCLQSLVKIKSMSLHFVSNADRKN